MYLVSTYYTVPTGKFSHGGNEIHNAVYIDQRIGFSREEVPNLIRLAKNATKKMGWVPQKGGEKGYRLEVLHITPDNLTPTGKVKQSGYVTWEFR